MLKLMLTTHIRPGVVIRFIYYISYLLLSIYVLYTLFPLKVARMITPLVPNNTIDEFKSSGRNKVTIITYNRLVANNILSLDVFKKNKLETFIPNSYIFKRGIIKNIPVDISDQEILQNLELSSPVENLKIHSIRRFYRNQLIDNTPTPTPTTTVLITFRGQVLPQFAFLYRVRHPVEVYIPKAKLCTNCFRHGHTKSICKSKSRCIQCGDTSHQISDCKVETDKITCINCGENHLPTNKICKNSQIEQKIITMATRKNISIQEAKNEYKDIISNRKRFRFSDFPELHSTFHPNEIDSQTPISTTPKRQTTSSNNKYNLINRLTPTTKHCPERSPLRQFSLEHKNALISTNGDYNLNIKAPFSTNKDTENSPPHTQVINNIFLCEDGHLLINNAIKVPPQDLLDYLMVDPNFNDIIRNSSIPLTDGQNISPIDV